MIQSIILVLMVIVGLACAIAALGSALMFRRAMKDMTPRKRETDLVFVSFASEDVEAAKDVERALVDHGLSVVRYDPERLWDDGIANMVGSIEHANTIVRIPPIKELTPWMRFEELLANGFQISIIDIERTLHSTSLDNVLSQVRSAPKTIKFRDHDDRYKIMKDAFDECADGGKLRAPNEEDFFESDFAGKTSMQRGDSPSLLGVAALIPAYYAVKLLVGFVVLGLIWLGLEILG